ncbi:MAG: SDR family oxidoreductase [Caulobacteraceae bacterium]|nr:SDR family oxidoreductase [Caulobacteraceae bacterium]
MLGYEGKKVLVVGGATGMGGAAAQAAVKLGAEVTVWDVKEVGFPVKEFARVDLRQKSEVEAALGKVKAPVDALLCCAGVSDGMAGLPQINWISQKLIVETLVARDAMPRGSAIGMISSIAGLAWRQLFPQLREFLAVQDWDAQLSWIAAHKSDNPGTNAEGYTFLKRAMCAYVATQCFALQTKGIRINSILPGSTDTPLARITGGWLEFAGDFRKQTGLKHIDPAEMGAALLFLCSPMASGVSGENLVTDQGYTTSVYVGALEDPAGKFLLGIA